jgi:hypothetical protein
MRAASVNAHAYVCVLYAESERGSENLLTLGDDVLNWTRNHDA